MESKKIILRSYQEEIFHDAMKENIVMVGSTGIGKTFVGLKLLLHQDYSIKRAIFMAPTRQLVYQIHEKLKKMTNKLKVNTYCGKELEWWDHEKWQNELRDHQVFICTPEIIRNNLSKAYIKMEQINLMIFDECHHVSKRHPYNQIMKFYKNYFLNQNSHSNNNNNNNNNNINKEKMETFTITKELPRIFGTTACPTKECAENLLSKLKKVNLTSDQLKKYAALAPISVIHYRTTQPSEEEPLVRPELDEEEIRHVLINEEINIPNIYRTQLLRAQEKKDKKYSFQYSKDNSFLASNNSNHDEKINTKEETINKKMEKFIGDCWSIYEELGIWCCYKFIEIEIEKQARLSSLLWSKPGTTAGLEKSAVQAIRYCIKKRYNILSTNEEDLESEDKQPMEHMKDNDFSDNILITNQEKKEKFISDINIAQDIDENFSETQSDNDLTFLKTLRIIESKNETDEVVQSSENFSSVLTNVVKSTMPETSLKNPNDNNNIEINTIHTSNDTELPNTNFGGEVITNDCTINKTQKRTPRITKLHRLVDLLKEKRILSDDQDNENNDHNNNKTLIFVQRRSHTRVVCEYLKSIFSNKADTIGCMLGQSAVSDSASFSLPSIKSTLYRFDSQNKGNIPIEINSWELNKAYSSVLNVLVTTAVTCEGVDFQLCNCVITLDEIFCPRQFIQIRGRCRNDADGCFYYFHRLNSLESKLNFDIITKQAEEIFILNFSSDKIVTEHQGPRSQQFIDEKGKEKYIIRIEHTGAILDLDSSISCLNQFCQSLPRQNNYTFHPKYKYETYENINTDKRVFFSCSLILPHEILTLINKKNICNNNNNNQKMNDIHVSTLFKSPYMSNKMNAKAVSSFLACEMLFNNKLLDYNFDSIYKKNNKHRIQITSNYINIQRQLAFIENDKKEKLRILQLKENELKKDRNELEEPNDGNDFSNE